MPSKGQCKVCDSEYRDEIDSLLIQGEKLIVISRLYKISVPTLKKHNAKHLINKVIRESFRSINKPLMEKEQSKNEKQKNKEIMNVGSQIVEENSPLSDMGHHINYLYAKSLDVIATGEVRGSTNTILRGVAESRKILELILKASEVLITRESNESLEKTVEKILDAVADLPETRKKIAAALFEKKFTIRG